MPECYQVEESSLTLLQNGGEYFPALCADIDGAKLSVHLETYIFSADKSGFVVMAALQRAALRGVTVRVLMDGFGSSDFPVEKMDEMRRERVEVYFFRPERYRFKLRRHRLHRLHRKLVVIDLDVVYIGGINIIDDKTHNGDFAAPRLDFAVRVQGPVAGEIYADMHRLWCAVLRTKSLKNRIKYACLFQVKPIPSAKIKVLLRDNFRHRRDIERAYLEEIKAAQREVIIANAYFLPGARFRYALIQAAKRGVRVVLLLQGRVEQRLLHYATHALYEKLLAGGVEIYEYQASFLHAKVAVIDGKWATVGSSNIDPFSLLLAREANLVVKDVDFALDLREKIFSAIDHEARQIKSVHWHWRARFLASLSYAVIRITVGLLGYGKSEKFWILSRLKRSVFKTNGSRRVTGARNIRR